MKIVILGAGALGSILGIKLTDSGVDTTLVDVNPKLLAAVKEQGGMIYDNYTSERLVPLKLVSYDELEGAADLIILVTKAMYTDAALTSAAKIIGPDTYVLTLQNGLGNIEKVSKYIPQERILVGTTTEVADIEVWGKISSKGGGHTEFNAVSGVTNAMAEEVNRIFNAANIKSDLSADIMTTIWEKVAHNSATNTLASVTRLTNAYTVGTEESAELMKKIMREVCKVANAAGIPADGEAVVGRVFNYHKGGGGGFHFPSMAQDVFAHRPTEISCINGAVVEKARELGVEIPYTETMYRLVRTIEQNYEHQYMVN